MENEKAWYETEEGRAYEEAVKSIRAAVEAGASFEKAAAGVDIEDEALKASVVDDALKVLIAEMHFMKKQPLEEVADKLGLPPERLARARAEMISEVEAAAIQKYKESLGQEGNA